MDSTLFSNPYLWTQIKNYIIKRGYASVSTSEWFSITNQHAWGLFQAMQEWDNKVLIVSDLAPLEADIDQFFP
jgi:hypothetical protein